MSEELILRETHNRVTTLTLNRPTALNALNLELLQAIGQIADELAMDRETRVVVLRGAGEKAFVAGADVKEMLTMNAATGSFFARAGQKAMARLGEMPQPVIAAVQGFALGGGFELALSCDMIWASPKASFAFPEVSLGLIPGFAGTQRLARATGLQAARDMILSGRRVKAAEALQMGAIARVLEGDDFFALVQTEAEKIASLAPQALAMAKVLVDGSMDTDLVNGSRAEASAFGLAIASADSTEGIEALLSKRAAAFSGN